MRWKRNLWMLGVQRDATCISSSKLDRQAQFHQVAFNDARMTYGFDFMLIRSYLGPSCILTKVAVQDLAGGKS